MNRISTLLLPVLLVAGVPAFAEKPAQPSEPGAAALLDANFKKAEREIREASLSKHDPARAINLGYALAMSGDTDGAAKEFRRAMFADEVQLVVADGSTQSSRDIASRALAALEHGDLHR